MENNNTTTTVNQDELLVKFGNYLFSQERRKLYKYKRFKGIPLAQRLAQVNHADIENFKENLNTAQ